MITAIFNNFIIVLSVVIAVLYLIRFRDNGKDYKTYCLYLVFIAIIQVLLLLYAQYELNNLFLFPYYFIGQFIFMSVFYYFLLREKWILWAMAIILSVLSIQYLYLPETVKEFNPYGLSITQSVIVIYALLHYYRSLEGHAKFLFVNAGVLMYFMTSILFFSSAEWILSLDLPFFIDSLYNATNDVLYFVFLAFMFVEWFKNYRIKK